MNKPIVIIYNFDILFDVLNEIQETLNYKVIKISKFEQLSQFNRKNKDNFVVISKLDKEKIKFSNHLIIKKIPINIIELKEKINLTILKERFKIQSNKYIKDYNLDLNSRELIKKNLKLKLTQKEIEIIILLDNSKKNQAVVDLQKKVWGYSSDLETHTVETHIYRLRKKILEKFGDNNFILSEKNGYKI